MRTFIINPASEKRTPSKQDQPGRAVLYIYDGMVVLLRRSFYAERHTHHSIQLVLSLEGSFQIECNEEMLECRAVVIPPDLAHQVQESYGWHVTILIEPESLLGRRLSEELSLGDAAQALPIDRLDSFLRPYHRYTKADDQHISTSWGAMYQHTRMLLQTLSKPVLLAPIDARVQRVIEIIESQPNSEAVKQLDFSEVALSKSRLSHLFVEQMGIPLSKYVLWARIKRAAELILSGTNFTESALQSGFSDLPHLSRTFKKMFGITMSNLFQDEERVTIVPPTAKQTDQLIADHFFTQN